MHRLLLAAFMLVAMVSCKSGTVHINVNYERLSGVVLEDHVLFQQNVAGSVSKIRYTPEGRYALELEIVKGFTNAVTEHSKFHIIDDPNREGHKAVEIRLTQQGGKLLADGTTVAGEPALGLLADQLQEDLKAGFSFMMSQIEKIGRDIQQIPESDAYKTLRQSIEALAAEIQRAEIEARDKAKKEWLPKIERELDNLKERLRQLGRENELQPLEERVERIRRI